MRAHARAEADRLLADERQSGQAALEDERRSHAVTMERLAAQDAHLRLATAETTRVASELDRAHDTGDDNR